jgi:hypothetical protein
MASEQDKDAKGRFKKVLAGTRANDVAEVAHGELNKNASAPAGEPVRDEGSGGPSLKETLLGDGPRFEELAPKRGRLRRRPPVELD